MFDGYRAIFWGLFFISFHFNLGDFQILPNFIGWAMILSGIGKLQNTYPSDKFSKAARLALIAVIYSVISLVFTFSDQFQDNFSPFMVILLLFIDTVELLMEYYLLSGSAEHLCDNNNPDMAEGLIMQLRVYLIVYFANIIFLCVSLTLFLNSWAVAVAVIGMILRICYMAMISKLKHLNQEETV